MQIEKDEQKLVRTRLQETVAGKKQTAPPSPLCEQIQKCANEPRESNESFSSKAHMAQQ